MRLRPVLCALLLVLWVLPGVALGQARPHLSEVWSLHEALDRPESVVYDADRQALYVSSIRGQGAEKNGEGYLSKLSPSGEVIEEKWITGLQAPKGLALSGDHLYVADIDEVVVVNVETGNVKARYAAKDAKFLNDAAVGRKGEVYVSDSGAGGIYRLAQGHLTRWLMDDQVQTPNGLHLAPDSQHLLVAAADSTASQPGRERYLRGISLGDHSITTIAHKPVGGLDAVEPDGRGGYFLTDWGAGTLLHVTAEGRAETLKTLAPGAADLEYVDDLQMLFLPVMEANRLVAYRVEWPD